MADKQTGQDSLRRFLGRGHDMFRGYGKALANAIAAGFRNTIHLTNSVIAVTILVFLALLGWEVLRPSHVSIEPIIVPDNLDRMGYSGNVVARRLVDSANEYIHGSRTTMEQLSIGTGQDRVDFILPTMGVSIKSVADYFRSFLDVDSRTVNGELIYQDSDDCISLRLRLNSDRVLTVSTKFNEGRGMSVLIDRSAFALLRDTQPFILASYFNAKANQSKERNEVKENMERAEEILQHIRKNHIDDENFTRAINLQGIMYLQNDNKDKAMEEFRIAIMRDPNFAPAYNNLGYLFADDANGDSLRKAIVHYRKAIRADPHMVPAYVNLGKAYAEQQNFEEAFEIFRQGVGLDPNNISVHRNIARDLRKYRQFDEAIEYYERVALIDPYNADIYNEWGLALAGGRNYDSAINHYGKAIALDQKNHHKYYLNWGLSLEAKGEFDGAINKYRKALELKPRYPNANISWGLALADREKYESAIKKYTEVIELGKDYASEKIRASAYSNWGAVLAARGDYNGAIKQYAMALKIDETLAVAHVNWGVALARKKNPNIEEAIMRYEKAVAIDSGYAVAYSNWGVVLERKGDRTGAIDKYRLAVKADPTYEDDFRKWWIALRDQTECERAARTYARSRHHDGVSVQVDCPTGQ